MSVSYSLEYIAGSNKAVYNLWETIVDDNGVERKIAAVIYEAGLAIDITNYLNEDNITD